MDEIAEVYEHLWQEIHRINLRWSLWCNWFSEDPERVALLNSEAGETFSLLQATVLESVLLALSRMADRHKIAGKETASFATLIERGRLDSHEVTERHQHFKEKVQKLTCWRNSHIAHKELAKIFSGPEHAIKVVEVSTCLSSALGLFNAISELCGESPTLLFPEAQVGVDVLNTFKRSKHLKQLVSDGHLPEAELFLALGPPPEARSILRQKAMDWRKAHHEAEE